MRKAALSLKAIGQAVNKVTPARAVALQNRVRGHRWAEGVFTDVGASIKRTKPLSPRAANKMEALGQAADLRVARANPVRKAPNLPLPDPKDVLFGKDIRSRPNVKVYGNHAPISAANSSRGTAVIKKPKRVTIPGTGVQKLAAFSDEFLKIVDAVYPRSQSWP